MLNDTSNESKALGADRIVAISRTSGKKADAIKVSHRFFKNWIATDTAKMGADDFIATNEDLDWSKHHERSLDLIICTVSDAKMPLPKYLRLLRSNGTFIQVGAPEDSMPAFKAFSLIAKGAKLGGSTIGSPAEIRVIFYISPYISKKLPKRKFVHVFHAAFH